MKPRTKKMFLFISMQNVLRKYFSCLSFMICYNSKKYICVLRKLKCEKLVFLVWEEGYIKLIVNNYGYKIVGSKYWVDRTLSTVVIERRVIPKLNGLNTLEKRGKRESNVNTYQNTGIRTLELSGCSWSSMVTLLYPNLTNISLQSRHFRLQERVELQRNEPSKHRCDRTVAAREQQKGQLITLITIIMVISTRAESAVITNPVLNWNYHYISTLILRIGLTRRQEEAMTQHREPSQQSQVKTKRDKIQQSDPLITLITVIVVISTRANIAVKLYSEIGVCCDNIYHMISRARLYKLKEKVMTLFHETSRPNRK